MSQHDRGTLDEPLLVRSFRIQQADASVGDEPGRVDFVSIGIQTSRLDEAHRTDLPMLEHYFMVDAASAQQLAEILRRAAADEPLE